MSAPSRIALLAGGVGGAKLAVGLAAVCEPGRLTVIGNVADDQEFHGLWVSPDIDTLTYSLAGLVDPKNGWGLAGDSAATLVALARLGCETWMHLGDRDFATHIYRTEQRRKGVRPSDIARSIARALGVESHIVLPTDDRLQTEVLTPEGWLGFQDYFVRRRCAPEVLGARFAGCTEARATDEAIAAIAEADLVVIAPSNPVVSIAPILAVPGLRAALAQARGYRVAVSPLIGGRPVKGPLDRMIQAAGFSCDNLGVADCYAGLIDALAVDDVDDADRPALRARGLDVLVTTTLMRSRDDKARLAAELIEFARAQWGSALVGAE